jgi:hypothetical protein
MTKKYCVVCGRESDELTGADKRNNLTERDVKLGYCRDCGECVCGFCSHLGVCCDQGEDEI